ncbi:leucine-rich repeat domain-containing protein [Aureispira anguillae]|uniref:Leucine-rich repeat domain-containing protein n=1 Tax=Aureispira anguillae TaxID=2864201 RepID=A0A915YFY8_9BACT|nr:leucine-rich repeat domain-containing protein [Aureispira anguillae]BDS12437.1 leucine-rich repeat domain-containing protein [Aureispira anguillae]
MSLYRPKNKNAFFFVVALLLLLLLLMVPLRPSVWDRDIAVVQHEIDSLSSTPLPKHKDSLITTSYTKQDTQVVFVPNEDGSQVDTNIVISPVEVIDTTTISVLTPPSPIVKAPQDTPVKAETAFINVRFLLVLLLLFCLLLFVIYKLLTSRWQKQYWLQYNAPLQPLGSASSNSSSFNFDFISPAVELESSTPQNDTNDVSTESITDSSLPLAPTELTNPEAKHAADSSVIKVEKSQRNAIIPDHQVSTTTVKNTPASRAFGQRPFVLFLKEISTRSPRILIEIGKGIASIFSFFSKGNSAPKAPLKLKWQDGISLVMILLFVACQQVIFPDQPSHAVANGLMWATLYTLPSLLRLHWTGGLLGGLIIFTELVSLLIYAILEATKDLAPIEGGENWMYYGMGFLLLILFYWGQKKKIIPLIRLYAVLGLVLLSGASYLIFMPYIHQGWDWAFAEYSGWGDVIARCIGLYIAYEVIAAIVRPNPAVSKKRKAAVVPVAQTIKTTPSETDLTPVPISTDQETLLPYSAEELNELFKRPNWYKKADLNRLDSISLPNTKLDEQSEFIVLYLPDCINTRHLYLSNNQFQEFPYEISELEQLEVLNLSYNQITDILPDIAYLKQLNSLYLAHNNISVIPDEMAELHHLKQLDLSGNPLTQESIDKLQQFFPNAHLTYDEAAPINTSPKIALEEDQQLVKKVEKLLKKELKNPDEVSYISALMQQDLSDLPTTVLQQFKNLAILLLNSNKLTAIPEAIYQLLSLKRLTLSFNQINAIPDRISELTTLEALDLSGNPIRSFSPKLTQLSQLKEIALGNMGLTTFPAFLLKMQQLNNINLSSNHLLRIPEGINKLPHLKALNLSFSGFNTIPDAIFELQELRSLDWTGNNLETLPSALTQLINLEKLAIGFNPNLSNANQVLEQLPKLRELHLSGLKADKNHPFILTVNRLKKLDTLWLSHNQLNELPNSFQQLKKLRVLSLAHNNFFKFPKLLGQLSNLEYLYLENNQLTALPKTIKQLKKLRQLHLTGNKIGITERRNIQRMLPNVSIHF